MTSTDRDCSLLALSVAMARFVVLFVVVGCSDYYLLLFSFLLFVGCWLVVGCLSLRCFYFVVFAIACRLFLSLLVIGCWLLVVACWL